MTYGDIYATAGPLEGLAAVMALTESLSSFSNLVSLVLYFLLAFGLYSIAQRRQISHAWLAFLPVANVWILGSIADQYQQAVDGVPRRRRKLLVALEIICMVLVFLFAVSLIAAVVQLLVSFGDLTEDNLAQFLMALLQQGTAAIFTFLLMALCALVSRVFQWICYYHIFASCNPDKKVLFTVLGILLPFLMPIFVFLCRNKDDGMPSHTPPAF